MSDRINGTSGRIEDTQTLVGDLDTFTMFVTSPFALDPKLAHGVNIRVTGNLVDESQKNFEVLVQAIGLRATPVSMGDPIPTAELQVAGAKMLWGKGFVWTFAVEAADVFTKRVNGVDDPIGLLVDELDGIVIHNGVVLDTKSRKKNVEIIKIKNAR